MARVRVHSPDEMRRLVARGEEFYREFHWGREPEAHDAHEYLQAPPVLVEIGVLPEIVYDAAKGEAKKREGYIHKFSRPYPRLACDPSGRQLYIVGGNYTIEWRGIVK